jgi:hypothetical protein
MSMSKKHFEAVARDINYVWHITPAAKSAPIVDLVERLAGTFCEFNPRFNASQFRAACYKEHE